MAQDKIPNVIDRDPGTTDNPPILVDKITLALLAIGRIKKELPGIEKLLKEARKQSAALEKGAAKAKTASA